MVRRGSHLLKQANNHQPTTYKSCRSVERARPNAHALTLTLTLTLTRSRSRSRSRAHALTYMAIRTSGANVRCASGARPVRVRCACASGARARPVRTMTNARARETMTNARKKRGARSRVRLCDSRSVRRADQMRANVARRCARECCHSRAAYCSTHFAFASRPLHQHPLCSRRAQCAA